MVTEVPVTEPVTAPEKEPLTATDLSAASLVKSSTGVNSKVVEAEEAPAGTVISRAESSTVWKWVPSVVFAPAATASRTVTAFAGSGADRAAVTVIVSVPPSSDIEAGETLSEACWDWACAGGVDIWGNNEITRAHTTSRTAGRRPDLRIPGCRLSPVAPALMSANAKAFLLRPFATAHKYKQERSGGAHPRPPCAAISIQNTY